VSKERTIADLLDDIRRRFPHFVSGVLKVSGDPELASEMELIVHPPKSFRRIPTFATGVSRLPSPMLQSRFQYASDIRHGLDLWLSPRQMTSWMKRTEIRSAHQARRSHWIGSPPNQFDDSQLSLFGITIEVPQNAVYLIWADGIPEPRVWACSGMDATEYDSLNDFFVSFL
jgi:hypothetical protein